MIKVVLAGAALAAVLAGCGAQGEAGSGPDDSHYQDCVNRGGSYSYDGNDGSWSCEMPNTVTTTPSALPS